MVQLIRLDAAGGSHPMSQDVIDAILWANENATYNINSDHEMGDNGRWALVELKNKILQWYSLDDSTHDVMITSCGSEGNNFALRAVADAGKRLNRRVIFMINMAEHETTREQALNLEEIRDIHELIWLKYGESTVEHVTNVAMRNPDTIVLWSQIHVNNELGSIYKFDKIDSLPSNVIVHTDAVQSFGVEETMCAFPSSDLLLNDYAHRLDFINIQFAKICGGMLGIGALIIRKSTIEKYLVTHRGSLIAGTSFGNPFRGGTPVIHNIFGALATMIKVIPKMHERFISTGKSTRDLKNKLIRNIETTVTGLNVVRGKGARLPKERPNVPVLYCLSDIYSDHCASNIILFTLSLPDGICNKKLKKFFKDNGVIISLSSLCQTTHVKSSPVVEWLELPQWAKSGVHRLSFTEKHWDEILIKVPKIYQYFLNSHKIKDSLNLGADGSKSFFDSLNLKYTKD